MLEYITSKYNQALLQLKSAETRLNDEVQAHLLTRQALTQMQEKSLTFKHERDSLAKAFAEVKQKLTAQMPDMTQFAEKKEKLEHENERLGKELAAVKLELQSTIREKAKLAKKVADGDRERD
jgi:chromosome segregation ATPase